jgi:GT2 family glycosyltransferase
MGKPLPPVAVVIPNWNGAEDLQPCLDSVRAQEGAELELIVVDNGSSDGSLELLRDEGVPHVALPVNTGFARAVNLGISRTAAPLVLVLNADTVLAPGAVSALAAELGSDPGLAGVQPRILSLDRGVTADAEDPEAVVYSLGQALSADGRARELGTGLPQGEPRRTPREIFGVCGAASMFRRTALEQLGGYDERYFAFYEDVDLNVRARIAGWSFRVVPSAVVWHVGNAAWQAGFERPAAGNARLVARNRIWTQFKFMPLRSLPRICLVEAGSLVRALRQRRFRATVAGKLSALRLLPSLFGERRRLRQVGDPALARRWLGEVH